MAKRRASANNPVNGATTDAAATSTPTSDLRALKPWSFLLYFCGDTKSLEGPVLQDAQEVEAACRVGLDRLHVVLQHDSRAAGAKRYLHVENASWIDLQSDAAQKAGGDSTPLRVNTGDQEEAIDFFQWALTEAPSQRVAVFFSGQGIKRSYAKAICKQRESFTRDESLPRNKAAYHETDLFSICHDESHHDALDVSEIRGILDAIKLKIGRPVDLVVFDAGCTAFLELGYQLRDVATVMIAPRTLMPDSGLPYELLLKQCNEAITAHEMEAKDALESSDADLEGSLPTDIERVVDAIQCSIVDSNDEEDAAPEMVVFDLRHMARTGHIMDGVASTLMSQLGDWHVLNAVRRTGVTLDLIQWIERVRTGSNSHPKEQADIPTRDLFLMLCVLEVELDAESASTPTRFGQLERLRQVLRVVQSARKELIPEPFLERLRQHAEDIVKFDLRKVLTAPETLASIKPMLVWLSKDKNPQARKVIDEIRKRFSNSIKKLKCPAPRRRKDAPKSNLAPTPVWRSSYAGKVDDKAELGSLGMLIMVPPVANLDADTVGSDTSIVRESNYHKLDFCRDVCWTSLLGALQLVLEKPHALWRLVTTFLFSRNRETRSATLQRFLSSRSVLSGLSEQFRGLRANLSLVLSLDVKEGEADLNTHVDGCGACRSRADRAEYLLRLQGADGSPRIEENLAVVYRSTIHSGLASFEELLNSGRHADDVMVELRKLGASLGEDIIQDLGPALNDEFTNLKGDAPIAPHLRFQIPITMMRYPWELMSDRSGGMLFERFALGRQFYSRAYGAKAQLRSSGPLRVLVLGDPKFDGVFWKTCRPNQLPGARYEADQVVNLFRELREQLRGIVDVWIESHIGEVITVDAVRAALRSGCYDIVHYCGHACFNADDPEGSAWLLSNGLLHAREIRNTLRWTASPPWLVYANACEAGMDQAGGSGASSNGDATKCDGAHCGSHRGPLRYQGDVFGLGSAFTNHGIRAYVAPLWPINDEVAVQIASSFYRGLLLERLSLGESLFNAKSEAKALLIGENGESQGSLLPARVALSWASLVLYGDPTQRLFESIWGGSAGARDEDVQPEAFDSSFTKFEKEQPRSFQSNPDRIRFMPRIKQASEQTVCRTLEAIGLTPATDANVRSASGVLADKSPCLQLVEKNGIRYWMQIDPERGTEVTLGGSNLAAQIEAQEFKERLGVNRGIGDYIKVVGKWVIKKVTGTEQASLHEQLAQQFDKGVVPQEGLFEVLEDGSQSPIDSGRWQPLRENDRVVLIIHGTFSCLQSPVSGFEEPTRNALPLLTSLRAEWKRQQDEAEKKTSAANQNAPKKQKATPKPRLIFLGYDHWTLSRSPVENAARMTRELHDLDPTLLKKDRLDVIVHSRGGLVARSFTEVPFTEPSFQKRVDKALAEDAGDDRIRSAAALEQDCPVTTRCAAVRRVIFLGTPNAGTQLANPKNAGRLADFLINLTHLDGSGFFARMSSLLAQIVVHAELSAIPGLKAQNPNECDIEGTLLNYLHQQETTVFKKSDAVGVMELPEKDVAKYWQPGQHQKYWCVAANYEPFNDNGATDLTGLTPLLKSAGLDAALDAFYDVANDLVVDTHGVWAFRTPSQTVLKTTGIVPPGQVLLFNPTPASVSEPTMARCYRDMRVHHCNLFQKREVRQFVSEIILGRG